MAKIEGFYSGVLTAMTAKTQQRLAQQQEQRLSKQQESEQIRTQMLNQQTQQEINIKEQEFVKKQQQQAIAQKVYGETQYQRTADTQTNAATQATEANRKLADMAFRSGDFETGNKYLESAAKAESSVYDIQTKKLGIEKNVADFAGTVLSTVKNQEQYDQAKQKLLDVGVPVPPQFQNYNSPETKNYITETVIKSKSAADMMKLNLGALTMSKEKEAAALKEKATTEKQWQGTVGEKAAQMGIPQESKSVLEQASSSGVGTSKGAAAGVQQLQRIVGSSQLAVKDLSNLSKLPDATSYAGFKSGEHGWTAATKDALTNRVTPRDNQLYDVAFAGMARNLATLEAQGAATGLVGLATQMAKLASQPNDTIETRMAKLAQMRQIVETTINSSLDREGLTDAQRTSLGKYLEETKKAVPFTFEDVLALQGATKNVSLGDIIKGKEGAKGGVSAYEDAEKEARYQAWKRGQK